VFLPSPMRAACAAHLILLERDMIIFRLCIPGLYYCKSEAEVLK
jgi:hypothetical protein